MNILWMRHFFNVQCVKVIFKLYSLIDKISAAVVERCAHDCYVTAKLVRNDN